MCRITQQEALGQQQRQLQEQEEEKEQEERERAARQLDAALNISPSRRGQPSLEQQGEEEEGPTDPGDAPPSSASIPGNGGMPSEAAAAAAAPGRGGSADGKGGPPLDAHAIEGRRMSGTQGVSGPDAAGEQWR